MCTAKPPSLDWLSFLNILGLIKVISSLIKYIPQAYLNYAQKSTHGTSISSLLLDFSGGILSLAQVLILCFIAGQWSEFVVQLTSPKLGLSLVTLLFNSIQLYQHYILYPGNNEVEYKDQITTTYRPETPTTRDTIKFKRIARTHINDEV
jgi:cystinosin